MKSALEINEKILEVKEKISFGKVKTNDGIHLAYAYYPTKKQVNAQMIFLHGGGAHCLAGYPALAKKLLDNSGIFTYLFDIRGHGKSGGERGDARAPEIVWEDVNVMLDFARKKNSALPIYLGGHSSGAGLILNYHQSQFRQIVDRYILLSPELGFRASLNRADPERRPFVTAAPSLFILNALSFGFFAGNSKAISFDYSQEMIENDNFLSGYTVNMARAVTPYNAASILRTIDIPTYIALGEEDELIDKEKFAQYITPILEENKFIKYDCIQDCSHLSIMSCSEKHVQKYLEEECNIPSLNLDCIS